MMLEKRTKLKSDDLIVLLTWLKGETMMSKKKFNFNDLLNECTSNVGDIDVEDQFDNLMFDLYSIYNKLKNITVEEFEDKVMESPMFNIMPKEIVEESKRSLENFVNLYEELIMNSKFEFADIRGIQKNMLTMLINKYIANEEYEKCSELQKKIKEV